MSKILDLVNAGVARIVMPSERTCRQCRYWIPAPAVDRDMGLCRKERRYRGMCPAGYHCDKWKANKENTHA